MLQIGVSQAQMQFAKLLDKISIVVDKKSKVKKAVIMPYAEHQRLLQNQKKSPTIQGAFDEFVGTLSDSFDTNDLRYQEILK